MMLVALRIDTSDHDVYQLDAIDVADACGILADKMGGGIFLFYELQSRESVVYGPVKLEKRE